MAHGSPSNESNIEIIFNRLNNMSREIADLKNKLSPEKDKHTHMINADTLIDAWEDLLRKELDNAGVQEITEIKRAAYRFRCLAIKRCISDVKELSKFTENVLNKKKE